MWFRQRGSAERSYLCRISAGGSCFNSAVYQCSRPTRRCSGRRFAPSKIVPFSVFVSATMWLPSFGGGAAKAQPVSRHNHRRAISNTIVCSSSQLSVQLSNNQCVTPCTRLKYLSHHMQRTKYGNTTFWRRLLRNHPFPPRPLTITDTFSVLWDDRSWLLLLATLLLLLFGALSTAQAGLELSPWQVQDYGALITGVFLAGLGVLVGAVFVYAALILYHAYRYGQSAQVTIGSVVLTGEAFGRNFHRIYTVQLCAQAADRHFHTTAIFQTTLRFPLETGRVISVLLHPIRNEILLYLEPAPESKKDRRRRRKQTTSRRAG